MTASRLRDTHRVSVDRPMPISSAISLPVRPLSLGKSNSLPFKFLRKGHALRHKGFLSTHENLSNFPKQVHLQQCLLFAAVLFAAVNRCEQIP